MADRNAKCKKTMDFGKGLVVFAPTDGGDVRTAQRQRGERTARPQLTEQLPDRRTSPFLSRHQHTPRERRLQREPVGTKKLPA